MIGFTFLLSPYISLDDDDDGSLTLAYHDFEIIA